ncbi:MAG: hypothetical protein WDO56_10015 [Gammaproteobacteria bacterium]
MIEDDARYCALIRHHLTCRWPDAELVVSSPVMHPMPRAGVCGAGLRRRDRVLRLARRPRHRLGEGFREPSALRAGHLPLSERTGDAEARQALEVGAHAALGKSKIDHERLLDAFATASGKQMQARADWRTSDEAKESQRFGEAFIRGYRRVRRLASGPVSELYLAESEQAGTLVVLKVARDQQAQNELDSFVPPLPAGIRNRPAHPPPPASFASTTSVSAMSTPIW